MTFHWTAEAVITETVPQSRTSLSWIAKRGLRIGAINYRVQSKAAQKAGARVRVFAQMLARLPLSLLRSARLLATSKAVVAMLMITRPDDGAIWPAKFLSRAQFIGCAGLQDEDAARRLAEAFAKGWESVQSLRREGAPDETCWFAGEGWWLSTAPPTDSVQVDIAQA